ncbi:MAG: dTDP-4-dehydrorhamnose reductase [Bacillota bacterium]|nr:dTDP-4-dehydrorhamnose reductase [Bacillota bacterium]
MRVLITGCNGMLGKDIEEIFNSKHNISGINSNILDITDRGRTINYIKNSNPDIVIHTAAYTDVDRCEMDIENAFKVNALGTRNIAIACNEINVPVVYISSDYVYDGYKSTPYYEYDLTNPINVYGRSKLEGENFIKSICSKFFIVRTSWLYGQNGKNFINSILKMAKDKNEISIVFDQVGSPTYTRDLAESLLELISASDYGTYHITNEDYCSWYDLARFVLLDYLKLKNIKLEPITSEQLDRPAARPKNSRLEKFYLRLNGYTQLRSYKEAVVDYLRSFYL